ncbi:MAG TPA: excalibur calcium-binding domain-containing protein [Kribbella sp.]|nr:excalibur calcium-binding domain-containing protein [Kribbella sp.]
MRQFNTPPQWPSPPRADWRPPRRWQPPESWPAPPRRWAFWVDEHGRPVRGPIGRYGGTRPVTAVALVAVPAALMALVLVNPFGHSDSTSTAPLYRPTMSTAPPTAPPVAKPTAQRTERPARLDIRTPTPTPTPTRSTTTTTTTPTPTAESPTAVPTPAPTPTIVVYKSCAEVRAAGKAPLHRGDPGYSDALDRNGDGVACDRGNS